MKVNYTLRLTFHFRGEAALRNRSGFDPTKDSDDIVGAFSNFWMYGEKEDGQNPQAPPEANRHEQEDGTILAVAATGKSNVCYLSSFKISFHFQYFSHSPKKLDTL